MHNSEENIPLWKQLEMQGVGYDSKREERPALEKKETVKEKRDGVYSSIRVRRDSLPDLQKLISMYHVKTGIQTNLAGIIDALIELGFATWHETARSDR